MKRNGVANPINETTISIRLKCKPVNMTVIQVYAPTTAAEDTEMEEFYEMVQTAMDETPKGDILFIMKDFNVRKKESWEGRNTLCNKAFWEIEMSDRLSDFCSQNGLHVLNTLIKQHARRLYTW